MNYSNFISKATWLSAALVLYFGFLCCPVNAQFDSDVKTVTLESRVIKDGLDNYTKAAFSFKYGVNGNEGLKLTRNNWDILFGSGVIKDSLDVSMITDDCSRIVDLGKFEWTDVINPPHLPAHLEPTREPGVKAIEGHIYYVHSKDRDSDHFSLFRVERLKTGESVTISWKLLSDLMPNTKP